MPGMYSKPLFFWLVLLFLGSCLGIFVTLIAARKTGSGENLRDILSLTGEFYRGRVKQTATIISASQMIKFVIVFCLGCGSGWGSRDLMQFTRTHTLHDIRITKKIDDSTFKMTFMSRPSDEFRAALCTSRPQFFAGLMFKEFTYEDRGSCWFIEWTDNTKLGYRLYETLYQETAHVEPAR